jgi:hypothetical protein
MQDATKHEVERGLDTDNFIFSGDFQAMMDIRTTNAFQEE